MLVEDNGRRVALVVDELLAKQEVVVKALGDAFSEVRGLQAARSSAMAGSD